MSDYKNVGIKNIFSKFEKTLKRLTKQTTTIFMSKSSSIITKNGKDTGLRGNSDGSLTVDKEVFYSRPVVQELLEKIENSSLVRS